MKKKRFFYISIIMIASGIGIISSDIDTSKYQMNKNTNTKFSREKQQLEEQVIRLQADLSDNESIIISKETKIKEQERLLESLKNQQTFAKESNKIINEPKIDEDNDINKTINNTTNSVELTLYFPNEDSTGIIKEKRIVYIKTLRIAKVAIEELMKGPTKIGLYSPIPSGTKLLNLWIEDNVCYVDFSKALINNYSGGAAMELITIKSIVDTLTEFPTILKVQILIEGNFKESIGGHIVLEEPIGRSDF